MGTPLGSGGSDLLSAAQQSARHGAARSDVDVGIPAAGHGRRGEWRNRRRRPRRRQRQPARIGPAALLGDDGSGVARAGGGEPLLSAERGAAGWFPRGGAATPTT